MHGLRSVCAAAVLCAAMALPSFASDDSRTTVMWANVERALQSQVNAPMFWQPLGNGTVREKRSGMICTGELSPDMSLEFLSGPVPVSPMSAVGCIYRSADNTRVPEGAEEGLTSVANGKDRLHYLASATVGSWLVRVHATSPLPAGESR